MDKTFLENIWNSPTKIISGFEMNEARIGALSTALIKAEAMSIVVPITQQLATLSQMAFDPGLKISPPKAPKVPKKRKAKVSQAKDNDGCPFPNCARYGRPFSRLHDLKRHIARHVSREEKLADFRPEETHACLKCGDRFYRQVILHVHMLMHEMPMAGPSYHCVFCNQKFDEEKVLRAHLPTHDKPCPMVKSKPVTNVDDFNPNDIFLTKKTVKDVQLPYSPLRCSYCSKTFKTKWTLNSHVAAHEGRFQYECCTCSKRFVRKSHYEGHVRTHKEDRPFVCEHCGKSFKQRKHRREHLKRIHRFPPDLMFNIDHNEEVEEPKSEEVKHEAFTPLNFGA